MTVVERSIESRGKTGKGLVRRRTSPFPVLPRLSMLLYFDSKFRC